jgi:RNA polymerase sigma-70 factor, ECF subfamily
MDSGTTPTPALGRLADEDLMPLVQAGRADAFEAVYDRHSSAAFSLAYRIAGSRNQAEDVVQEAFLSIWRSGGRYDRHRGSVRTWILGIIHNRAVDQLRRNYVHDRRRAGDAAIESMEETLEAKERTEDEVGRRSQAAAVRTALADLPSEQSRVIELAFFGGFTHTEIADLLEAPVGTVKGRMRLGMAKLRTALEGAV